MAHSENSIPRPLPEPLVDLIAARFRIIGEPMRIRLLDLLRDGDATVQELSQATGASLLAASGCVAISGGLEVASDRLLKLMQKGVTVAQVARVTRAFTDAGIMVHAYLMYGFPSETAQETVDALERVRQLFEAGCIQSAYWHRFSATAHSPIGLHPERYGITLRPPPNITFAHNDLRFDDPVGADHDFLGAGLNKALYNYMQGLGLDADVRSWFEAQPRRGGRGRARQRSRRGAPTVPATQVPPDLIARALG